MFGTCTILFGPGTTFGAARAFLGIILCRLRARTAEPYGRVEADAAFTLRMLALVARSARTSKCTPKCGCHCAPAITVRGGKFEYPIGHPMHAYPLLVGAPIAFLGAMPHIWIPKTHDWVIRTIVCFCSLAVCTPSPYRRPVCLGLNVLLLTAVAK